MSTTCTEVHTSFSSSRFSPRTPGVAIPPRNGLKTQADIGTKNAPEKSEQKFKLTVDTINPYVKNMEYAVRGKMPQEAAKIEAAIKKVTATDDQEVFVWQMFCSEMFCVQSF